jgi:hypothetical protein
MKSPQWSRPPDPDSQGDAVDDKREQLNFARSAWLGIQPLLGFSAGTESSWSARLGQGAEPYPDDEHPGPIETVETVMFPSARIVGIR